MRVAAISAVLLFAGTSATADLFDSLDRNSDGKITAAEISESQARYFKRALRVSDRDEDGALTRIEFTAAISDPTPVEVSAGRSAGRGRGEFDPTMFDRNKDGYISENEVPAQLKERLQRFFNQYGKKGVPVDVFKRGPGQSATSAKPSDRKPADPGNRTDAMKRASGTPPRDGNITQMIDRLDTNNDGKLDRRELQKAPAIARFLDRDKDGAVSAREIAAARQRARGMTNDKKQATPEITPRGQTDDVNQAFRRLDRNKDGKLTGNEIPQRLRNDVKRFDTNHDKAISKQEMQRAMQMRQRGK
ncbi:MAG: hypothetical protein ABGZ53_25005 [Fuerstiella sp.]